MRVVVSENEEEEGGLGEEHPDLRVSQLLDFVLADRFTWIFLIMLLYIL